MPDFSDVAALFSEGGYQWKFKDGYRVPTVDDIDMVVGSAMDELKDHPDRTQMEVGRMIVQKNGQFYDIYMHVMEIPGGQG